MICYILLNRKKVMGQLTKKKIIQFVLFFLLVFAVISVIYYSYLGGIPFISQFIEVSNSNQVSSVNVGYELNAFYYIEHLPQFISSYSVNDLYFSSLSTVYNTPTPLAYVILLLSAAGMILFVAKIFNEDNREDKSFKYKIALLAIICIFTTISY